MSLWTRYGSFSEKKKTWKRTQVIWVASNSFNKMSGVVEHWCQLSGQSCTYTCWKRSPFWWSYMWKSEGWKLTNDNYPQSLCSPLEKKGRSQYHHTFTYIRVLTLPQQAQRQTPKKFVEAPGLKIMTTTTALPLPVPRLKQCTLSGYSSEMPSNSYINSQSKLHQKKTPNSNCSLKAELLASSWSDFGRETPGFAS